MRICICVFSTRGWRRGRPHPELFLGLWGLLGELTAARLFKENCALSINSPLMHSEFLTLWGCEVASALPENCSRLLDFTREGSLGSAREGLHEPEASPHRNSKDQRIDSCSFCHRRASGSTYHRYV